jgi:hypothetical protein
MSLALITAGGIGDSLFAVQCAALYEYHNDGPIHIYVNSHQEIVDFINGCTFYKGIRCPDRVNKLPDPENPLCLPKEFLDQLYSNYDEVYSAFPDALGQAPFSFPWFRYTKAYKNVLKTKIHVKTGILNCDTIDKNTKNVFLNLNSITIEKNYPLTEIQKLVNILNQTEYNVIIARCSSWKGQPLPFFCQGKYCDLVDKSIDEVVSTMSHCDYFCGIDSGLSHVAYHLDIPRIVLHQQYNQPFHLARYHEDVMEDMPLNSSAEQIAHRIILNLRDSVTTALPTYFNIPCLTNTKQLLFKKYYD